MEAKTDLFSKIYSTLHLKGLASRLDVPFILGHVGVKYPQEEDCVIFNKTGPTFLMTSRPLVLLHHSWLDVSASVDYHGKGWGPKVCWARRRIGVESWATYGSEDSLYGPLTSSQNGGIC